MTKRLLILGGTGEAAALAERAVDTFGDTVDIISSLAGRVAKPRHLPGHVRIGGFGGCDGLTRYIEMEKIDLLIDATHPFATTISATAHQACRQTGTPRLIIARPPWPLPPCGKVIEVVDFTAAATTLSTLGRRAFLTFGHRGLEAFASLAQTDFLIRVIEKPKTPTPIPRAIIITGRPPFSLVDEKNLLQEHEIDVLVSKNSGGASVPAKITAALDLKIPIILIARPPIEPGEHVTGIEEALYWVSGQI